MGSGTSYVRRYGARIAARDGWTCYYCGHALVPYGTPKDDTQYYVQRRGTHDLRPHYKTATVDHLVPRANGGTDDLTNLVLSCRECNTAKGTKLPLEAVLQRGKSRRKSKS